MNLSAWAPTIVTVIGWIFFAGIMWQKMQDHEKRLSDAEIAHKELSALVGVHAVNIGKLESWKDGYAAARSVYDHRGAVAGD